MHFKINYFNIIYLYYLYFVMTTLRKSKLLIMDQVNEVN